MRGIPPFSNHLPVRIRFEEGLAERLADVLAEEGARSAFILLDAGMEEANPAVSRALQALDGTGAPVTRWVKPVGEPTTAFVDAAAEAIGEAAPDAIVAIGGGAVIDTAKAARLCAQRGRRLADWLASDASCPAPTTPLLALPTTAGTGSEVSGGAVITDPAASRKTGIASPLLRPQYALVDPVLTWSLPPAATAYSGIDALAQAIAAMIARTRTPIGDAIALEAVRLAGDSLAAAYRDGGNAAARSRMACASLMAGLAMNISDCCAEHSLAQAIGGTFEAPHGLTVGLVLAETLEREREHVPGQLERVADALGAPDDGSGDGSRAVRAVRRLVTELELPTLRSLGVGDEHLDVLTQRALADPFIGRSPQPWTPDEVRAAFAAALERR